MEGIENQVGEQSVQDGGQDGNVGSSQPKAALSNDHEEGGKEKPVIYKCDWEGCKKGFIRSTLLVNHRRIHTGEQPFHCPIPRCDFKTAWKGYIAVHIRTVHRRTNSRYECEICHEKFYFWNRLIQHLQFHRLEIRYSTTN
jgi:uncharacterized Zn-finger protein